MTGAGLGCKTMPETLDYSVVAVIYTFGGGGANAWAWRRLGLDH